MSPNISQLKPVSGSTPVMNSTATAEPKMQVLKVPSSPARGEHGRGGGAMRRRDGAHTKEERDADCIIGGQLPTNHNGVHAVTAAGCQPARTCSDTSSGSTHSAAESKQIRSPLTDDSPDDRSDSATHALPAMLQQHGWRPHVARLGTVVRGGRTAAACAHHRSTPKLRQLVTASRRHTTLST